MTANEATVEVNAASDEGELPFENPPPEETTQPDTTTAADSRPLRRSERVRAGTEKTTEETKTYKFGETVYKVGNSVYYEETGSDCFAIGSISEFRSVRRGKCEVVVKRFARTFEVWDVAKAGVVDREAEASADPRILARELFSTETHVVVDSSLLRGKCCVTFSLTFDTALQRFDPLVEDAFFCAYAYQPEYRRINTLRAEIRVGERFQVSSLPVCRLGHPRHHEGCSRHVSVFRRLQEATPIIYTPTILSTALQEFKDGDKAFQHGEEKCLHRLTRALPRKWEELRWKANALPQETLSNYLAAVRSLVATRAYGGGGVTENAVESDMRSAANGRIVSELVVTAQHALDVLHSCSYDIPRALQFICQQPLPENSDTPQHWTREQVRRLSQGLQLHGKDFFAIHRDFFASDTAIDPLAPQQEEEDDEEGEGEPESDTQQEKSDERGHLNGAETKRWLCGPSREKSVKQLISFFYYWKRKGHLPSARASVASRNNNNSDASASTAFHAALNSASVGGGRGNNSRRKRIDTNTTNGSQLENAEGANGNTPRVEHGVSPLPEGFDDAFTTVSRSASPPCGDGMCSNCSLAPVETEETSPATASVKAIPGSLCKECGLFWRKYVALPKPGEVLTKKSLPDGESDNEKTKASGGEGETVDEVGLEDTVEEDSSTAVASGNPAGSDAIPFETKQELPRPLSGCSFCDGYSPTYAFCWSPASSPVPSEETPTTQQPEDLSITSTSTARLKLRQTGPEGEASCARTGIVFDAKSPPPPPPPPAAARRFDAHSLLYEPSAMSQTQKRRAVSPPPQSPPRPKLTPLPPQPPPPPPQQQPIELTARTRQQMGPPRAQAIEEYVALFMRDPQRFNRPRCTASSSATTTTTTTTQARGTFYPPPAEPLPPPSSSSSRQQSMPRRHPPPPPPPFPQRQQQQSRANAYMQQGGGDAGMSAFLRDQFLASSHARSATFHGQHQQEQERLMALMRLQQQQQQQQQAHIQQRSESEQQQQLVMSTLAQLIASGRSPSEAQALLVQAMATSAAAAAAARVSSNPGETQGTALAQLMMQRQQTQPQRSQDFPDPEFFNYVMQYAAMTQQNAAAQIPPPQPQPPPRGEVDFSLQRGSRTTQPPPPPPPPPPVSQQQQQQAILMQYMMQQQQQQQAFHEQQQRQNYLAAAAAAAAAAAQQQQQRRTSREQDTSLQEMARWLATATSAAAGAGGGGGGGRQVSPQALQALLQQFVLQQGQR